MRAKITKQGQAKLTRLQTLPKLTENVVLGAVKKEIDRFIEMYQKGLENNDFGLIPLQPSTVRQKERQGFSRPSNPLFGAGDQQQNSLYNVFKIRKLKNGYKIYMRNAKHWKANLTLKQLFLIHNYGAKIQVGERIIQIPPRPVFLLTYERLMNRVRGDRRLGTKVKRAITEYINEANYQYANEYLRILKKQENVE